MIANAAFADYPELDWLIKNVISPFGQIFLRLIFMAVIPLIFSAIALGVAELGDVRSLGRIGIKTLVITIIISTLSVFIGVGLVNAVQPGYGLSDAERESLLSTISSTGKPLVEKAAQAKPIMQTLLEIIPKNPLADAVGAFDDKYTGGGILALMFFSLFVGLALTLARSERTEVFEKFLQGLYDVVMKIIDIAMKMAPIGVACLLFSVVAKLGTDVIFILGKYVAVVLIGLALHCFGVYALILKLFAKVSPWQFFKRIEHVIITAFSTSSSNVTLPTALAVTETNLTVPKKISRFVLTVGSTANQNGTALFEGITILFLAQFFGVHLTFAQQFTVVLAAILAGIGTAGVPGGSLPVIVLVLQSVGVPGEGIGIILGVDRILDMSRTVVNVTGDITVAMVVAKSEGHEFDWESTEGG